MRSLRFVKTIVVPRVPPRTERRQILAQALLVSVNELDEALRQGLPALRAHNKRTARILEAHFGLGGLKPTSREKLASRHDIAVSRVGRYLKQAVGFIGDYYDHPADLVRGNAALKMPASVFFKRRRFMERLTELKPVHQYRVAGLMRYELLGSWLHRNDVKGYSLAEFLTDYRAQSAGSVQQPFGPKTFAVLRRIVADAGLDVREWDERQQGVVKDISNVIPLRKTG